ncbi:MAG: SBBP repeat-containing protein [Thermoflexales bacterium]|nr:SBBP repeat-containing protein [Thermoflexales bacterium]
MISRRWQFGITLTTPAVFTLILLLGLTGSRIIIAGPATVPAAIETNWHTFLGSTLSAGDDDQGHGAAVDSAGYAYVVGTSNNGDWGSTPITDHVAGMDGFLAKLDSDGALLWHTFVGGSSATDSAQAITIDAADQVFVAGTSYGGEWSTEPITDNHGARDAFVAKFNASGERQWFTFVGTNGDEWGNAIAVDDAGNIYVGGTSVVNPYLAKLDSAGEFQWQRVITSTKGDLGYALGIATDQSGGVYITGFADYDDWHNAPPSPVREHSSNYRDTFVAKLVDGEHGAVSWYTFLGPTEFTDNEKRAILVDTSPTPPAVYVAGWSTDDWGTPIQAYAGSTDAFVAQLNGDDGSLVWHTFIGSQNDSDEIHALALDGEGAQARLFVAGDSGSGWGRPVISHPEGSVGDAVFVAALSTEGRFLGHTFLGGASSADSASGVAVSEQGGIYVVGSSSAAWNNPQWGSPIRAFHGSGDAFVAGLGTRSVVRYWIYAPLVLRDH